MTLQAIGGSLLWPQPPTAHNTPRLSTAITLDAVGDAIALVFRAPATGSINQLSCLTGTVSTGGTCEFRLETVSTTTGLPTGTLANATGGGSMATVEVTATGTWYNGALSVAYSATKGDLLALVIKAVTGFAGTAIIQCTDRSWPTLLGFPYTCTDTTGGGYTKTTPVANASSVFGVGYDDGASGFLYYRIANNVPVKSFSSTAYNSGSGSNELGNRFRLPFAATLSGMWCSLDMDAQDTTFNLRSDGSPGSVLASLAVDKDVIAGTATEYKVLHFATSYNLVANTWYRVSAKPGSTTNVTLLDFSVHANGFLDMTEAGKDFYFSSLAGSTWTDTTTKRALCGLVLTHLDNGISGGAKNHILTPGVLCG